MNLTANMSNSFSSVNQIQAGSLYTWGEFGPGLGRNLSTDRPETEDPAIVSGFSGNVEKVNFGKYHTGVITSDGRLYTFGLDQNGSLGLGKKGAVVPEPAEVDLKGARAQEVSCGISHTIVLTTDGQVLAFGDGGNSLKSYFVKHYGGLGTGTDAHASTPIQVELPSEHGRIISVQAGNQFSQALTEDGTLFNWGNNAYNTISEEEYGSYKSPVVNDQVQRIKDEEGVTIKKLRSNADCSLALFSDGSLRGWGCNNYGNLGVYHVLGVEIQDILVPKITRLQESATYNHQRVVDFDLGENMSIFMTEDGKLYK